MIDVNEVIGDVPGRTWRWRCARCGEYGVVRLAYGAMEEWLAGRRVCPSGRHVVRTGDLSMGLAREREVDGDGCRKGVEG